MRSILLTLTVATALAAPSSVAVLVGTGIAGYSGSQVNNPYGLVVGPDGGLYFCDLDNQRVRRLDLRTRQLTTIAGSGERGYRGDGGPAVDAALNMPHELRFDARGDLFVVERDSHVVRRIDMRNRVITTVAGTGRPGFGGDGGPAVAAQLRQPHSIAFDRDGALLICDIGNHRIRRVDMQSRIISTFAGTGEPAATPDGAPLAGTPLRGPRTIAVAASGDLYIALREGNAIYRLDARTRTLHRVAGTGETGYSGDGGPARLATLGGPKGLALARDGSLYVADTENHAIRRIDLARGTIDTVLGTGARGTSLDTEAKKVQLSRPHGVFADGDNIYVADSESHRILVLQ